MYKNVGKSIKAYAWVVVLAHVIVFMGIGLLISVTLAATEGGMEPIIGLCIISLSGLIGYAVGKCFTLLLYAYGELVDCVIQLKQQLCSEETENV